jgi:long-chain fatty acid transport protein
MKTFHGWLRATSFLIASSVSASAIATTGYFSLGFGAKSMGLAGAIVSNPQDSITAAVNPAGLAMVGERVDVGIRMFNPVREAKLSTSLPPVSAGSLLGPAYDVEDKSRRNFFFIPNVGFTKVLNNRTTVGFSIYGNGGMNTTYDDNMFNQAAAVMGAFGQGGGAASGMVPQGVGTPNPQTGTLGVDLAQSLQSFSIAYKANETHMVGAALVVGIQRFSARGLGNFSCLTGSVQASGANGCLTTGYPQLPSVPSPSLTDNGSDWSYGAGLRVGWLGELTPTVTVGASFASKVYMTEFDDYSELFAEQGDFDIPANFTVGVTVKATPKVNLSFDFQRILYEGVNSISNAGPIPSAFGPSPNPPATGPLGADNGLGFGWEDINIYRVAAEYMPNERWTYRAGFALNDQPIGGDDVLFNILAPAVIEKHATVGFTFMPNKTSEWSFAYMHAFEEEVSSPGPSAFGIPASIKMHQNSVDLSYSKRF